MEDNLYGYSAKEWMMAFLELLDGSYMPDEIKYFTGLSDDRCEELSKMFQEATKDGFPE